MRLIELTLDYPYSNGETFCKDELTVAENYFEEIIILSLSGHVKGEEKRYIPQNAILINARKKRYELLVCLASFAGLFRLRSVKELFFAKYSLNVAESIFDILKELFLTNYYKIIIDRALKKIKVDETDILYSYWMTSSAYAISHYKKPMKITRTHRFDCFIDCCYQPYRREIVNHIDYIYSISNAGKSSIEKEILPFTNVDSSKVLVARLGIIERGEPCFNNRSETEMVIVSCSNVIAIKRLDLILGALELIHYPIKWIHIGTGDEIKRIEDKSYIIQKNHKNVTIELKGNMKNEDIYSFYETNQVDLFINCSDSEGIPVSIMEALSFGIPVIARDVGGNAEIVDSTNGILLESHVEPLNIAEAIKTIHNLDNEQYYNLRLGAYRMFKERFEAGCNYRNFFEDIIMKYNERVGN